MESILVTGGAGFIGSNIAEALLAKGHRVVILDDLSTGKMENVAALNAGENLKFVKGSIRDNELLRSLMKSENVSLVSHQAAVSSVSKSIADPVRTMETNIAGTANLFHVAAESGCRRIVYASSSSVYGDAPELPKRETMPLLPKSPYAMSKAAKEMLSAVFGGLYPIEIVGLRYFNVYGKRQDPASDYAAVIPKFITQALRDEPITIEGDGGQTRDFIYVEDVVNANIMALTCGKRAGGVFNVANGEQTSILDLAQKIVEVTGSKSSLEFRPARSGDIRDSVGDTSYTVEHLGYRNRFGIQQGLADTVAWYRDNTAKQCAA
jgi:UDP-N-acetylglucosamine/UDP-N-acetyl-alpha-D-glucosaminouronate 4-epimerase